MTTTFDVIIVGGRPAGAALAVRLGAAGLSVLVVDKSTFPSAPEVPSCPVLYPKAMLLLDEIGFSEDLYAHATTPVKAAAIVFDGHFAADFTVPTMFGRDHVCGFDRAGFDAALWEFLGRSTSVTRRAGFRVDEVLRDESGRVVGISGAGEGGAVEPLYARLCVVGADGRHSLIARKVQAKVIEDQAACTSTVHFAEWEGLAPYADETTPIMEIVTRARGLNVLFFPSANGRTHVTLHARSDRADTGGDAQGYYMRQLEAFAEVRRRLVGARQVGPLLGMRRIANRYREHGGPGWVLLGDSVHHKDPVDGQGVYDALVEGKRLAALILELHRGAITWPALVTAYGRAIREETGAMFKATMQRLERELYQEPPVPVIRTFMRWLLQDPAYQRQFFAFLAREVSPDGWLGPKLLLGAAVRGLLRDLGGLVRRVTGGPRVVRIGATP